MGDTRLRESHSLVHKLKWGNGVTDTHTHTWFSDLICLVLAYLQRKQLQFKDTTACSMDQGYDLILECKICVTWRTIIIEPY